MMLGCFARLLWIASSACNCFGRSRECVNACSLLMNFIAMTGEVLLFGIAFRML